MVTRGVLVGRFQPPHFGHLKIIEYATTKVDELIIIVAAAQISHTKKNPLTAGERVYMLEMMLRNNDIDSKKYWIIPAQDIMDNSLWVHHLERLIPPFDTFFGNNPFTQLLFSEAGYNVASTPMFSREQFEASRIREMIIRDEDISELVDPEVMKILGNIGIKKRFRGIIEDDSRFEAEGELENESDAGSELKDIAK